MTPTRFVQFNAPLRNQLSQKDRAIGVGLGAFVAARRGRFEAGARARAWRVVSGSGSRPLAPKVRNSVFFKNNNFTARALARGPLPPVGVAVPVPGPVPYN